METPNIDQLIECMESDDTVELVAGAENELSALMARIAELETLVDSAKPIIELWKDKCDYSWREDWLAKACELLAGGIPIKPEDVDL